MEFDAHESPGRAEGGHVGVAGETDEGGVGGVNSTSEPERVVEVGCSGDGSVAVGGVPDSHVRRGLDVDGLNSAITEQVAYGEDDSVGVVAQVHAWSLGGGDC